MAAQNKVKESLIQQLKSKGAYLPHFESLVDDYCWYHRQVQMMKKDIRKKGVTYMSVSAAGKEYEKDNPNVKMLPTYTRQMLQILKDLGLTTDNVVQDEDDEL